MRGSKGGKIKARRGIPLKFGGYLGKGAVRRRGGKKNSPLGAG